MEEGSSKVSAPTVVPTTRAAPSSILDFLAVLPPHCRLMRLAQGTCVLPLVEAGSSTCRRAGQTVATTAAAAYFPGWQPTTLLRWLVPTCRTCSSPVLVTAQAPGANQSSSASGQCLNRQVISLNHAPNEPQNPTGMGEPTRAATGHLPPLLPPTGTEGLKKGSLF